MQYRSQVVKKYHRYSSDWNRSFDSLCQTREAKDEMGGLCQAVCEEDRRGGRMEEGKRRVKKTIR